MFISTVPSKYIMVSRKLQMIGGNRILGKQQQAYIAVPMSWVHENDLNPGDILDVSISNDKQSIIVKLCAVPEADDPPA